MTTQPDNTEWLDELLDRIMQDCGFYTDADMNVINPEAKQAILTHFQQEKERVALSKFSYSDWEIGDDDKQNFTE